jgi:CRP-like cAMP-binding protein
MTSEKVAISIIEGLTKGSITINKTEEFKKILAEYPDDPQLNRLFADFLKKEHSFANAIKKYRKAYDLFMAAGETLQAIAALLELWEVAGPTPHDFRGLYSQLCRKDSHSSVVAECFAKMSYKELRATLSYMEKIRVKTDGVVQHPGEPEESLFFVISGELVKSPAESEADSFAVVQFLKPNDHFGDDFPCDVKRPAPYLVRAASDAELLKISKQDFLTLTGEFPDLKSSLKKLIKYQLIPDTDKPDKFFRKTSRRHLSVFLGLDILDREPGRHPVSVKGFSSDISLGGACVIIDPRYRDIPVEDIVDRQTKLRVSLPDETINVTIMGKVAWCRKTEIDGEETFAIGVQFNEMPPRLRGSMIIFVNAVGIMNRHVGNYSLSQDEIESRQN